MREFIILIGDREFNFYLDAIFACASDSNHAMLFRNLFAPGLRAAEIQ